MAGGVNKVILIGNLGKDPVIRSTASGIAHATFSIATSERWDDKDSGEKREKTEWHNIVAWRRLAEICGNYLKKGSQVYIEGKLQTRKWTDKDNNERYTTEIVAQNLQILSPSGQQSSGFSQSFTDSPLPDEPSYVPEDDIPF